MRISNSTHRYQPVELWPSLICANMLALPEQIARLEAGGAEAIHCDVMDGTFVPRFGLHPELIKATRSVTALPLDVHMMTANPEPYLSLFADAGATSICVHTECTEHLYRTLSSIRKAGIRAGVAFNPATPLHSLDYLLDDIDLVTIMAINPGVLGQTCWPTVFRKIRDLRTRLVGRSIQIVVDGGVTFDTAAELAQAGADALVCGSATIFRPEWYPDEGLAKMRACLSPSRQDTFAPPSQELVSCPISRR